MENKSLRSSLLSKWKIILIVAILIIAVFIKTYSGYLKAAKLETARKFSNIESEIFGLVDNLSSGKEKNQRKAGGDNEIYTALIHNQIQIDDLRSEMNDIKKRISVYSDKEIFAKLIFSYYDLRQKIFLNQNYQNDLDNFKLLAKFDDNLMVKANSLEAALSNAARLDVVEEFAALIPKIVKISNGKSSSTIFGKIKFYLSQSIIVRRTDGAEASGVDKIIIDVEKFLKNKDYANAYRLLSQLPSDYNQTTKNFLINLSYIIKLYEVDGNILAYLKGLI